MADPQDRRLWLLVRAGGRMLALHLDDVIEVMRPLPIEPFAGAPDFVLGVARIRGAPYPVIELARLHGSLGGVERFVAIRVGPRRAALAVDDVIGVRAIESSAWARCPPLLSDADTGYVDALGTLDGELLTLLRRGRTLPAAVWPVEQR